jgi:hypothetical protein
MSYIYLHTADMDERILYSFDATSTAEIETQMKEANEECDRITRLRRREMNTYEDDEMYDEIKNWMAQASEELARRSAPTTLAEDSWDTDTDTDTEKKEDTNEYTLPPPLDLDDDGSVVTHKSSLPTLDEYNSMSHSDKSRWNCIACNQPALQGSAIPGSFCSSACALQKYG